MDNKEKIRQRYQSSDDEIKVIKAKPKVDLFDTAQKLRVCAYCRVSTDNEEQTSSYELQKAHFEEYIKGMSNWELVEIYADEGISGTSTEHRESFNRMINDAREGKIDVILTKSISRFARNVVDTILITRELKNRNPSVRIIFESERLDTGDPTQEMILNILAMMAEEESRNKSRIMNWSYDERFKRGNFMTPSLFGYRVNEDKEYIIQEDEAEVIRLVFSMYVTGYTPKQISETMAELGMKSNMKGESKWSPNVVRNIIDNERRSGKIIAWKTFTPNFLDHKIRKNRGERNQYYKDYHHEGIIPLEMYEYAIKIKNMYKTAHFFGEIPELRVVKTGVLKGFVPICRNYPGFSYDNYLLASNYAYKLDEKGNRIPDKNTDLLKSQVSEFDLEGFEKVDSQLMMNNSYPTVWFKYNQMFFNTSCLQKMNKTGYIELLFEPYEWLLAIRSCEPNHPNAIRWAAEKDGVLRPAPRSCSGFASVLFDSLGWDTRFKYKIVGVKREKNKDAIVIFSLEDAEPMTLQKTVFDDGTESIAYTLYNSYFLDHFGKDIYDDAYSNRLYLMDIFNKWNLKSEVELVEDEEEWLVTAKSTVAHYIELLKERRNTK
ncbi:MAG: recombinase family protein [Bacilli bacterium]|nr:recombinase family protein [Bacilli bacterium]